MTSPADYAAPQPLRASFDDIDEGESIDGAELCDFSPETDMTLIRSVTGIVGAVTKERDAALADWFRPMLPGVSEHSPPERVFREVYKQLVVMKELKAHNEDLRREVSSLRRDFVMLDTDRAQMIAAAATREERLRELELAAEPQTDEIALESRIAADDLVALNNATSVVVRAAYLAFFVLAVQVGCMIVPVIRGLINL